MVNFDEFWMIYPRKVGKLTAKKSWEKLSAENKQKALEAIEQHKQFWEKKETEWDYIPHASTWLNQERWHDELDFTPKKEKQDMSWMVTNEGIEKKARELGVLGNGYDTYQTLKKKCLQKMGINLQ